MKNEGFGHDYMKIVGTEKCVVRADIYILNFIKTVKLYNQKKRISW